MILKKADVRVGRDGAREWLHYSDGGGISQFGLYVETLPPGGTTSERHWHEKEDEMIYVLSGELTVIEEDGPQVLHAGDAAVWAAGKPIAHLAENRSTAPCQYVVVGTRVTHDVCHYPDSGRRLFTEGEDWRVEAADGTVVRSGKCKSPPGRD